MTTFANAIGQTAVGVAFLDISNSITPSASTQSGQTLQVDYLGVNSFLNSALISASTGILQDTYFPLSSTGPSITTVGTPTTVYTAGAQIASYVFSPVQTTSTFYAVLSSLIGFGNALIPGNLVYSNVYLNSAGSPVISAVNGSAQVGTGALLTARGACLLGQNFSTPQTLNVCLYRQTTASTPNGTYDNSYIRLIEMSSSSVSPQQVQINSSSAQLCLRFPVAQNTSITVEGEWAAFNTTTEIGSNGGSFTFVAQRTTGNVSLSNNNVFVKTLLGLNVVPYIEFIVNTSLNTIDVNGVGIAGTPYNFNFYFTTN